MEASPRLLNIKAWVQAARPRTLTAALVPIWVGSALALKAQGHWSPELAAFALLSSIFIQVGTNLINDAMDFKKGADTQERLGPKRVTQSGVFTAQQVWWAGLVCFALAIALALPLVLQGGFMIVGIGILSLIAGYVYTGGPYPLAYRGLGDLFVLIFFGWVAVLGMYFLNTGSMSLSAWIAGTQVGLLATVLIAINNARDAVTDQKVGKMTLAARFGHKFAQMEIRLLYLITFLLQFYWLSQKMIWAFYFPLALIPRVTFLLWKLSRSKPGPQYNQFLAQSALIHLAFGGLLGLGFILSL